MISEELGLPVPEWLRISETYGFGAVPWHYLKQTKWRFITHVPHNKEYLMALRENGMRGFPYVTFYQAPIYKIYQGMRLSDHPDWIEINNNGHWKRTGFWESEDSKNVYCVCSNVKEYRKAILEYVEYLMDIGAGGIFLDNIYANQKCWGPEFGKHEHIYSTQLKAFTELLRETQLLIRKKDPEGALLVNSANPVTLPQEYWRYIDSDMSESYICTWVSKKRWGNWEKDWNGMDKKLKSWVDYGKQICCLSYVGHTDNPLKDDAYFCYASARLMNFIWQGGNDKLYKDPECSILYQIEIGQPITLEYVTLDKIHYRIFHNGMVVVNPTEKQNLLEVNYRFNTSQLYDLYEKSEIKVKWQGSKGSIKLLLPPRSGRVYLFEPIATIPSPWNNYKPYRIEIETHPLLGKCRFQVDNITLWTHSGRWTTEYIKGPSYGKCQIDFDAPGVHRVKLLDIEKRALLVAENYSAAYKIDEEMEEKALNEDSPQRLGKLMDPSNPGKLFKGKGYRFTGWSGSIHDKSPIIKLKVDKPMKLIANFCLKDK